MAAEGAPVKLPATDKHTQSRTFTLHAVRSLAGPALSLSQSKTAIISGEKRYGEKREEKVPLRSTSRIVHDDTLRENPHRSVKGACARDFVLLLRSRCFKNVAE